MQIPIIFVIFIIFIAWLQYEIKKTSRLSNKSSDEFWQNESDANISRKKDISNLDYIKLNIDLLPLADNHDSTINSYRDKIVSLVDKKIINLSSFNNTQLKQKYGAANLPFLTDYDNNYMVLVSILQKWAERLYQSGDTSSATHVLEYAVSCSTDVTNTYRLLSKIYKEQGEIEKLDTLINTLSELKIRDKNKLIGELNLVSNS